MAVMLQRKDYSIQRFMSGCRPATDKMLRKAWKEGDQLAAKAIPKDGLPIVTIMAAWGNRVETELVDDYDLLLERMKEAFDEGGVGHPDLYLASCIVILAQRGETPTIGAFEQVNVPNIFSDLLGLED